MALTFAQAVTILQSRIADSSNSTAVTQALNQAHREVARARRWPELVVRAFVNTVAAYTTGTVATNGTTTVTLTGGVWPTDIATGGYRFALGYQSPWYTVATRSSDTVILLAQAYIDADVSASTFVVYKSHYSMASTVDRVEEVWLHGSGGAVPLENAATDSILTDWFHHPSGAGVPWRWYAMERDGSGNRQVLLGPTTPDDVYRVEYVTKKKVTDDTFTGGLDETRWPVVLSRASYLLYKVDYPDRAAAELIEYDRLLREEWGNDEESETQSVRMGEAKVAYPGRHDYSRLIDRGTVSP